MSTRRLHSRNLKKRIFNLLKSEDLDQVLKILCELPARQVINPLLSFLLNPTPKIRWASITALGAVVANLATLDLESARVIMRRLMWQLNDESGGIGWGCPETMGEVMACHDGLAQEYAHVLVSYVMEKGNFLEYEPLRQGAVWGIGRIAQVKPDLVKDATYHLMPFIESPNPTLRGLTVWALGMLGAHEACSRIEVLLDDDAEIEIYLDRKLDSHRVKDLAHQALVSIGCGQTSQS
jgi:HEAT repeat protein